jgi:hypothetical protein
MVTSTWNYRVFEFESHGETYRDIRTVYYADDKPHSYSAEAASVGWQVTNKNPMVEGIDELVKFTTALLLPVLRESDFT